MQNIQYVKGWHASCISTAMSNKSKTKMDCTAIKRIAKSMLFGVLCFCLSAVTCVFAANVEMQETVVSNSATTLQIPVVLTAAANESISSVECTVRYDSTVASFSSADLTSTLINSEKMIASNVVHAGELKFLVYGLNSNVITDGSIAVLNFNLVNPVPDSQISLYIKEALSSDPSGVAVNTQVTNNVISVGAAYPEVSITLPAPNQTISRLSSLVRATVSDSTVTDIVFVVQSGSSSQEYPAAVVNGIAETTVDMNEGENVILAYGYNSSAQLGMDTISVLVDTNILGVPQFTNQATDINTSDFRLTWTDEAASGAVRYELSSAVQYTPAALQFDGNDDYISIPDSPDFDICGSTTDDWTIDFWIKMNDYNSVQQIMLQGQDGSNYWVIQFMSGKFRFLANHSNDEFYVNTGFSGNVKDNDWHHIALCKVDTAYAIYIDGDQVNFASSSVTHVYDSEVRIGTTYVNDNNFNGFMDEIRVQKSNVYNSNPTISKTDTITVPNSPSIADQNTKLLLHCDESTLTDASTQSHTVFQHSGIAIDRDEWDARANSETSNEIYETTNTYYDVLGKEDGSHQYRVRAFSNTDDASEYSDVFTMTIDSTNPDAPAFSSFPSATNQTTMDVSGTKTADSASITLSATNMTVNAISYPTETTWQANVSFSQDGTYAVSAIAHDAATNESPAASATILVDTAAPAIASVSDNVSVATLGAGTTVIVTAVGEADCAATFCINGVTSYASMTETSAGNYRGTYTIQTNDDVSNTYVIVKLVDAVSNETVRNGSSSFTIDTVPPTIATITENSAGATLAPADQVLVVIEGEAGQTARFTIDGVVNNKSMVEVLSGRYQGIYTVQSGDDVASATVTGTLIDSIGNSRSIDANTTVRIDTIAPVVTMTSHTNNEVVTARDVTVVGTVDDSNVSSVEINGSQYPVTNGTFSALVNFAVEGINVVTITATDQAGNSDSTAFSLNLVFPPEVPQFTAPVNLNQSSSFRLEWSDEAATGAARYEVAQELTYTPAALQFDGNDDYVSIPDSPDFDICGSTTDDWTIDFWIKMNDYDSVQQIMLQGQDGNNYWVIQFMSGRFRFLANHSNDEFYVNTGFSGNVKDNDWHHIALCKVDTAYAIYIDGDQVNYASSSVTHVYDAEVRIGTTYVNDNNFNGFMDEIRIQKSNVYNSNPTISKTDTISVPSSVVTASAETRLLLHCDEDSLVDSSSQNHSINQMNGVSVSRSEWPANVNNQTSSANTDTTNTYLDEADRTDGTYSYRVRAFTAEGVASAYSTPIEINVDTVAPTAPTIVSLPALTTQSTRVISGAKSSDTAVIAISAVGMTVNSITYPSATTWEADVTFTQDGAYDIGVVASDLVGNASVSVWTSLTLDTTAPVVAVTSPSNGYATPQKSVSIVGTVDDPSVSSLSVQISNGDGNSSQTLVVSSGDFTLDYSLFKGVNTFTFSATDAAGNVGTQNIQVSFTNNLPLVFLPVGNKAIGFDETLAFTVGLVDQGLIHPELLTISATGLPTGASFNASSGAFSWTPSESQLGLHQNISFVAQDDNKMTTETIKIVVQRYDMETTDFQQIMGSPNSSQVVVEDFNNDNYLDIYMTNVGANSYFINNQDGTFTESSDAAGCSDSRNGVSALSVDVNDDGYMDLYVVNEGTNALFMNNGDGTFSDGSARIPQNGAYGIAAYAQDINRDGAIDIFLVNDDSNVLFINNGLGSFTDMTGLSGVQPNTAAVMACLADIDGDNDCDIYIIEEAANVLYINDGTGNFSDVTATAGVGDTTSSCLTRIYDYDYDGDKDIVINDQICNVYYTNRGDNTFEKVFFLKQENTTIEGKQSLFFDYDRDGDSDIYIIDENARFVSGLGNILYANNGDGTFSDSTVQSNLL